MDGAVPAVHRSFHLLLPGLDFRVGPQRATDVVVLHRGGFKASEIAGRRAPHPMPTRPIRERYFHAEPTLHW
jgi:hypothetical protein